MVQAIAVIKEIFDSDNHALITALVTSLQALKLAFKEVIELTRQRTVKKMIEEIEVRFGQNAVKKGYIKGAELIDALQEQVQENLDLNNHRLIGKILIEKGKMTLDQVNDILKVKS